MKFLLCLLGIAAVCSFGCRRYEVIRYEPAAHELSSLSDAQAITELGKLLANQDGPTIIHTDVNKYGFYVVQKRNPSAIAGHYTVIFNEISSVQIRRHRRSDKFFVEFFKGRRCVCRLFYRNRNSATDVKKFYEFLRAAKSGPIPFKPMPARYVEVPKHLYGE